MDLDPTTRGSFGSGDKQKSISARSLSNRESGQRAEECVCERENREPTKVRTPDGEDGRKSLLHMML